jgi:hypothetical protein
LPKLSVVSPWVHSINGFGALNASNESSRTGKDALNIDANFKQSVSFLYSSQYPRQTTKTTIMAHHQSLQLLQLRLIPKTTDIFLTGIPGTPGKKSARRTIVSFLR